jgi:hypothetical protein
MATLTGGVSVLAGDLDTHPSRYVSGRASMDSSTEGVDDPERSLCRPRPCPSSTGIHASGRPPLTDTLQPAEAREHLKPPERLRAPGVDASTASVSEHQAPPTPCADDR